MIRIERLLIIHSLFYFSYHPFSPSLRICSTAWLWVSFSWFRFMNKEYSPRRDFWRWSAWLHWCPFSNVSAADEDVLVMLLSSHIRRTTVHIHIYIMRFQNIGRECALPGPWLLGLLSSYTIQIYICKNGSKMREKILKPIGHWCLLCIHEVAPLSSSPINVTIHLFIHW